MKFFVETANTGEIKKAKSMGMLDGVSTNRTLVAREDGKYEEILGKICQTVDGPVNVQVTSLDGKGMLEEARRVAAIHENMVVEIPMSMAGLKATRTLAQEGIRINASLIFSPLQALMAAKAGAAFVSVLVGAIDDVSQEGLLLVEQIVQIYSNYAFDTEIIVANVRNPLHVLDSAVIGADIAAIPFSALAKLAAHPLTDRGVQVLRKSNR